jgi:deoxyribonuclease-4
MISAPEHLHFGVAGIPNSCPEGSSLKAIDCVISAGLEALELEFVHGLKMSQETATRIRLTASKNKIRLSAHAPYFINLNSDDPGRRIQSQDLLLNSLRLADLAGATDLVFHAGYYGKKSAGDTYRRIKGGLDEVLSISRVEKLRTKLRIETMGKISQFGTLDEVLAICRETDGLFPCLDFAHIFAREGRVNSYHDFYRVLSKVEKKLGRTSLKNAHIHISGVKFNQRGEVKHLNLEESEFRFDDWLQALEDVGVAGTVICESPSLEADALLLKNLYHSLREKKAALNPVD